MVDEEYIRGLAQHLQKQSENRILESKENQRKAEILKTHPLAKWPELKNWIREIIRRVNQIGGNIDCTDHDNLNELVIFEKGPTGQGVIARVAFNQLNGSITCRKEGEETLILKPEVRGNDVVYTEDGNSKLPFSDATTLGKRVILFVADYGDDSVWAALGK